jgi:hypothetical protein
VEDEEMRSLRSIGAYLLLVFAGLGLTAATPGGADAQYYRWHGSRYYPHYWRAGYYNPYSAYSPYSNWYGTYGGYYGTYPYYTWYRAYPWGGYY